MFLFYYFLLFTFCFCCQLYISSGFAFESLTTDHGATAFFFPSWFLASGRRVFSAFGLPRGIGYLNKNTRTQHNLMSLCVACCSRLVPPLPWVLNSLRPYSYALGLAPFILAPQHLHRVGWALMFILAYYYLARAVLSFEPRSSSICFSTPYIMAPALALSCFFAKKVGFIFALAIFLLHAYDTRLYKRMTFLFWTCIC